MLRIADAFLGASLLFCLGTILNILFGKAGFQWKGEIDLGTIFNILSAIATSVAAIAAWKSADFAKTATRSAVTSARVQLYFTHQQQFDRMLDETEKDTRVSFFRRTRLYDQLFPGNRHLDKEFSVEADTSVIEGWVSQYVEIEGLVKGPLAPSAEYIESWMKQCIKLSNDMSFNFQQLDSGSGEILYHGSIPTYFTVKPGKPVFNLGEVIHRLATFGLIERPHPLPVTAREHAVFLDAYRDFYESIANGRTDHKLS
jgi:hypothetical protein